jgi:hypothetical protein
VIEIIHSYKPKKVLKTDIHDIFNDRLDLTMRGWDDLKRLNRSMLATVDKFEYLDLTKQKTQLELVKYLHNFEVLQTELGSVEEMMISDVSQLQAHQDEANALNKLSLQFRQGVKALEQRGVTRGPPQSAVGSLLDFEHLNKINEWYGTGWKLLYKASRDGWSADKFHEICCGRGSTITVIAANGFLFGGYLSVSWPSKDAVLDDSASLFTLTNKHNIPPTKFAVKRTGEKMAFYSKDKCADFGGPDLQISNNASSNKNSCIDFPNYFHDTTGLGKLLFVGHPKFTPSEVEVYYRM